MKTPLILFLALAASLQAAPPAAVSLPGSKQSPIASGLALPAGRAMFWTSGTVAETIKEGGKTAHEACGDTYTQGVSILKNIERQMEAQGLTMKDVVYLRVYVAPDMEKDGKPDFPGWFKAYGEFFNNPQNPNKTARSTVGVAALVAPVWLIEVEAFAVYPAAPAGS
jgi:enamine deaminase RidA (YjgF/YER057c/UK114 family)